MWLLHRINFPHVLAHCCFIWPPATDTTTIPFKSKTFKVGSWSKYGPKCDPLPQSANWKALLTRACPESLHPCSLTLLPPQDPASCSRMLCPFWKIDAWMPALPLFSLVWGVAELWGTDFLPGTSCKGRFWLFCMNTPNACVSNNGCNSCFSRRGLVLVWPWEDWIVVFMAPPGGRSRKGILVGLEPWENDDLIVPFLLLPAVCVAPGTSI